MGRGDSLQAFDFADVVRVGLSETRPPAGVADLAENVMLSRMQEANQLAGRHVLAELIGVKQGPLADFLDGKVASTPIQEALGAHFSLDPPLLTCMTVLASLEPKFVRPNASSANTVRIKLAIRELQARGFPWDQHTGWLEHYMEGNATKGERDDALRALWDAELSRIERNYPILPVRYISAAEGARGIIRARAAAQGIESAKELSVKSGLHLKGVKNLYSGDLLAPELPSAKAMLAIAELLGLGVSARFWACIASETLPFAARENGKRISSIGSRGEWNRQLALLKAIDGQEIVNEIVPMIKTHPVKGTRTDWEAPFRTLLDTARAELPAAPSK